MHDKPPSLKWPLIWTGFAIYLVAWAFIDAVVDVEEDRLHAALALPLCVVGLIFALRFLRQRLAQRQQWRAQKFVAWLLADNLPAPEVTDWQQYERDLELRLRRADR
jgi:hypothetical protein